MVSTFTPRRCCQCRPQAASARACLASQLARRSTATPTALPAHPESDGDCRGEETRRQARSSHSQQSCLNIRCARRDGAKGLAPSLWPPVETSGCGIGGEAVEAFLELEVEACSPFDEGSGGFQLHPYRRLLRTKWRENMYSAQIRRTRLSHAPARRPSSSSVVTARQSSLFRSANALHWKRYPGLRAANV